MVEETMSRLMSLSEQYPLSFADIDCNSFSEDENPIHENPI